jgi:hypothetical protein
MRHNAVIKAIFVAVLLGSIVGSADLNRTNGMVNGRAWNEFNAAMKAGYLIGLSEGSEVVAAFATAGKDKADLLPSVLNFGEISAALDLFYKEPTNAPVPVVFAVSYVKRKAEGASEAELKQLEADLRRKSQ